MRVIHDHSFMQFTASSSDYFGNRLRVDELNLRMLLNLTYVFDRTVWQTDADTDADPTVVNAYYLPDTNQICKHDNNYACNYNVKL